MDHIPTHRLTRDQETERAAKLQDVQARARLASPVAPAGKDILSAALRNGGDLV